MARRASSDFEALVREYSDGPTKTRGGDLGFFREGDMAQELFNFTNKNKVGNIGLVETEFGFHIVKVTDKDDLALIADVVAAAVPSDKTANEVFRNATQFEMDSNEDGDFNAIAEAVSISNSSFSAKASNVVLSLNCFLISSAFFLLVSILRT